MLWAIGMPEEPTTTPERVDDIPALLSQAKEKAVSELPGRHFRPHDNRKGAGLDWTRTVWSTQVVSEGNRRLNQTQEWVGRRLQTL